MPNINQDVQGRVDAFRDNPQALQERYGVSNDLMDLLALQYIKNEREEMAVNAQLSAQGTPGTVEEQLTAEMGVGQGIGEQQNIGMPPSGGIAGDMSAFAEGGMIQGYDDGGKVARNYSTGLGTFGASANSEVYNPPENSPAGREKANLLEERIKFATDLADKRALREEYKLLADSNTPQSDADFKFNKEILGLINSKDTNANEIKEIIASRSTVVPVAPTDGAVAPKGAVDPKGAVAPKGVVAVDPKGAVAPTDVKKPGLNSFAGVPTDPTVKPPVINNANRDQTFEYLKKQAPLDEAAIQELMKKKITDKEKIFGTGYQSELDTLDKKGQLKKRRDLLDKFKNEGLDDSSFKDDRLIQGLASMGGGPGAFARSTFTLTNQQKKQRKEFLEEQITGEEKFDDKEAALTAKEFTIREKGEQKLTAMTDKQLANLKGEAAADATRIMNNNATLFNEIKGENEFLNIQNVSADRQLKILSEYDVSIKNITEKIYAELADQATGLSKAQSYYNTLLDQGNTTPEKLAAAKKIRDDLQNDLAARVSLVLVETGISSKLEDLKRAANNFGITYAQVRAVNP